MYFLSACHTIHLVFLAMVIQLMFGEPSNSRRSTCGIPGMLLLLLVFILSILFSDHLKLYFLLHLKTEFHTHIYCREKL